MKKFAAICDTSTIFNYPPIISTLAALGLNDRFKTIDLEGELKLFSSSLENYQNKDDIVSLLKKDNVTFDCIYCGNLNKASDIKIVSDFITNFRNDNTSVVINPVLEDDITSNIDEVRGIISKATVITPSFDLAKKILNLKEDEEVTFEAFKTWLRELSKMGPKVIIMTDVLDPNHNGEKFDIAYDGETSAYYIIPSCYKKDAKFNFVDVLTDLIIKDTDLSAVMNQYL